MRLRGLQALNGAVAACHPGEVQMQLFARV